MREEPKPAVVFIVFNRPEATQKVFDAIRAWRPSRLLIIGDGPRNDEEREKCEQVRAIVNQVDWPCQVESNLSGTNLGCRKRVSSGLSWAFSLVEEAIILEDDCVPHPDFFEYCWAMLVRYRLDTRVMMVCGSSYLPLDQEIADSYFFTNYYFIWGWATWRRAWVLYDVDIKDWPQLRQEEQLNWLFPSGKITKVYAHTFDLITKGCDTWDIQWWYACIFNHGLAIMPRYNLVTNIGLIGTHSQGDFALNMPVRSIDPSNLKHPARVCADAELSRLTYLYSHQAIQVTRRELAFYKAPLHLQALRWLNRAILNLKSKFKAIISAKNQQIL